MGKNPENPLLVPPADIDDACLRIAAAMPGATAVGRQQINVWSKEDLDVFLADGAPPRLQEFRHHSVDVQGWLDELKRKNLGPKPKNQYPVISEDGYGSLSTGGRSSSEYESGLGLEIVVPTEGLPEDPPPVPEEPVLWSVIPDPPVLTFWQWFKTRFLR